MLSLLFKLISPFFLSTEKKKAWGYSILLVTLSFSLIGLQVLMSYANRYMMNAVTDKDLATFWKEILFYLFAIAIAIPVGVFYRYAEEKFSVLWRDWMTNKLLKKYFYKRSYYMLRGNEELDNPDQRITEDVRSFTGTTLSFALIILNSFVTLVSFVGVIFIISKKLVAALILYAIIGTVLTVLIGKRLVKIYFLQYQKEADFRYGLVRVKDNAESIAFFRGEPRERLDLMSRLGLVIRNSLDLINWNRNLAFFTSGYNYVAILIPIAIVAPMYIKGNVEFGAVSQAAGAFAQVLAATSIIITQFERLSAYSAGVKRLNGLWEALHADASEDDDDPEISIEEGASLAIEDLTIRPPKSDRKLVVGLSLKLPKKKGMLIMGASGTGKSSILRTVAGLWNFGEGTIKRQQLKRMLFLPQKPYLIPGSLKANLLYPNRGDINVPDETLIEALKSVHLDNILERLDDGFNTELDWSNILSLGEQQRLSFARVILYKPDLVFLDEATSALDEENEKNLYGVIKNMSCSFVSVGHRSTLIKYHDLKLTIEGHGKWKIDNI